MSDDTHKRSPASSTAAKPNQATVRYDRRNSDIPDISRKLLRSHFCQKPVDELGCGRCPNGHLFPRHVTKVLGVNAEFGEFNRVIERKPDFPLFASVIE